MAMVQENKPVPKKPQLLKTPKTPKIYECTLCDFITNNKKDYGKHLLTKKHIKFSKKKEEKNDIEEQTDVEEQTDSIEETLDVEENSDSFEETLYVEEKPIYKCLCGHTYKHRTGLCRHKTVCKYIQSTNNIHINLGELPNTSTQNSPEEIKMLTSMMAELMKNNAVFQQQMFDMCKLNINTISNNTINSHNKTFNLQFFLNEQCKDAMNITDFANSFDLQLSDLETVGELGYVEGITKIIVDKLNSMDIYKRPMHCSDAKREIIYVKDENVWTKEEKDNPKLRQAIKNVSFRNMKLVYNWSNAYPESKDSESRLNDKYMELVIQSTGGNNPIVESENKIIRRIAKEIVIGKNNM